VRCAKDRTDGICRPELQPITEHEHYDNFCTLYQYDNDDNLEEIARFNFDVACSLKGLGV
jgi:hypothetical protein